MASEDSISILLINGPNLNLLGTREPAIYGSTTLADVIATAHAQAESLGIALHDFQSNSEGAIIDRIHLARTEKVSAIVINPGGLTHTSVALMDALVGVDIPFVEVHVSNVHAREEFRHKSFLSEKAVGVVCGLGVWGYEVGVEAMVRVVKARRAKVAAKAS